MQGYDQLVIQTQAAQGAAREEAFGELIAQFQAAAHSWAYNVLGDSHLAQDVTQEAFLTAYQRIDQLREPAAFPAWLKRIVLTYCHRVTRRRAPSLLPLEDEGENSVPSQSDPAASAEDRDLKDQVNKAVRALPQHEREVTELFYITGYSQQEIAEALAVPLTTVKKRLQYAREHLREAMPPMNMLYHGRGDLPNGLMPNGLMIDGSLYDGFGGESDSQAEGEMLRLLMLIYPELLVTA